MSQPSAAAISSLETTKTQTFVLPRIWFAGPAGRCRTYQVDFNVYMVGLLRGLYITVLFHGLLIVTHGRVCHI